MHPLTFGFLNVADLGPLDTIRAAAAGGFTSVGLRVTSRRPDEPFPHDIVGNTAMIRDVRMALDEHGLRLSNISTYHIYPDVELDHLLPVLETSARMGAGIHIASCYDPDTARFIDKMARYADAAAGFGIRIALENVSYSQAASIAQARRILDGVARPNFGMLLDPLHLYRAGQSAADLALIAPQEIVFAQLCDGGAQTPAGVDLATEAKTMRLYPGDGALPLAAFLAALPDGLEIEAEVPAFEHRHLSGPERARILFDRTTAYLAATLPHDRLAGRPA